MNAYLTTLQSTSVADPTSSQLRDHKVGGLYTTTFAGIAEKSALTSWFLTRIAAERKTLGPIREALTHHKRSKSHETTYRSN